MKAFCSRCGEADPDPIRDDDGDLIYWFRLGDGDDGSPALYKELPLEEGERHIALIGITMKDFGYDGSFDVICPQCAMEECPLIKDRDELDDGDDALDDDGWLNEDYDPFDDDAYEEFLD